MSNSVGLNFYEFIGFITFSIAVHELIFDVYISFFLILVFLCPWCRVLLLGFEVRVMLP